MEGEQESVCTGKDENHRLDHSRVTARTRYIVIVNKIWVLLKREEVKGVGEKQMTVPVTWFNILLLPPLYLTHPVVILAFIQQTFIEYLLSARPCRQKMNKFHNLETSEGDKHVRKKQRKSIKI